jgi:hypothetical protein
MRPNNVKTVSYVPEPVPADPSQIPAYLEREFNRIRSAIDALALGHVDRTHVAPVKPRNGDIRLADGTNWSPGGGGQGFYGYYNNTWNKLG